MRKPMGTLFTHAKTRQNGKKMNGTKILPPMYKKHVGRPTKSRRKGPYEVNARGGGKIMSRHGVIMHCSYCGFPDHNRAGCTWFKQGLPPPNAAEHNVPSTGTEPVIIQVMQVTF
jgi:hypothetical protein